jgi:hypothetical protein
LSLLSLLSLLSHRLEGRLPFDTLKVTISQRWPTDRPTDGPTDRPTDN